MQATENLEKLTNNGKPLPWHSWPQAPSDIDEARSVLNENPLKGMSSGTADLGAKRAIVFGVGATGGVASGLLAQSGIGFLDIVDPDSYGIASFTTQPAPFEHRGRPKALVQGERAQRMNPACRVRAAFGQAQDLLWRDLRKSDVFVVAGDNLDLLVWAGRKAAALAKPLVQAAVHGETASAIVRCYDLRDVMNACPKCGMSERELSNRESRLGCDIGATRPTNREATRTMPAICHAAGVLAANEAIKWLAEKDQLAMRGEEFVCSMFAYQTWRTELPRNLECNLPHSQWKLEDVPLDANQTTLGDLAGRIGTSRFAPTMQVCSEIPWISFTFCDNCGGRAPVQRFARARSDVGRCECRAILTTIPQGMRSVVPFNDLKQCWDTPIAKLGIESGEAIGIQQGEQWIYFFTAE